MKRMLSILAVFVMIAAYGQSQLSPFTTTTDPQIITQWDFNNLTNSNVANPPASTGVGTASIVGMTTSGTTTVVGFNPANCNNATSPNFGWNVSNANPGTVDEARGVEFMVSTVGFENITFSFAHRVSNASTRTVRIQYTLDGSSWINLDVSESNYTQACSGRGGVDNGKIDAHNIVGDAAGDTWKNVTVNFSSISGVNNNPNFGLRVVAAHFSNSGQFRRADNSATASTGGAWRFDDITISGTPTSGGPVDPVAALSATPSSLTGFAYVQGSGPSSSQTFQVTAENLTPVAGNISVTAPTGFEVSADNVTFSSSIEIPYVGGALAATTVHVRLVSGLLAGPFTGSVTVSGGDAPNDSVALSGSVTAPPAPFVLPYTNGLRTQANLDDALAVGFTLNSSVINTGAGGYLQLLTIGTSHFTTPIAFNSSIVNSGIVDIEFSLATFGTGSNREVQLQRVDASGQVLEVLASYFPTSSTYDNHVYQLNLSNITGTFGLRFAYTAGSASSIRFRDLNIAEGQLAAPSIAAANCNTTINNILTEQVFAESFPGATQWIFKIDNGTNSFTVTRDVNSFFFFNFLSHITYGTTYQVSVAAVVDGVPTAFGNACPITLTATPKTTLLPEFCGSTLPNMFVNMQLRTVLLAAGYRIHVKNMTTNEIVTVVRVGNDSGARRVRLSDFSNAAFGTTFKVWAEVTLDGVNYIEVLENDPVVCEVFAPAPAIPTTQMSRCNTTLPSNLVNLTAVWVSDNVQEWNFVIVDANDNTISEVTKSTNGVLLSEFPALTVVFGTPYLFKVRVKMFNTWGNFGTTCTITTAGIGPNTPIPTTQLVASRCNTVLPGTNVILRGAWVSDQVTSHTFALVDENNNIISEVERPNNDLLLSHFSNVTIQAGTTYRIRVKVQINNIWGSYGGVCTVTTPGGQAPAARLNNNANDTEDQIVAFPNPFVDNFTLKLANQSSATIAIFEVNGRLVEKKSFEGSSEITLGNNLSKGVYFVLITQGEVSKTIKMTKK